MAFLSFLAGAVATGGVYWYKSGNKRSLSTYETKLETLTGDAAREHFLWVCLGGGVAAVIAYVVITLRDPYGTKGEAKRREAEAAARQEIREARRDTRFDFLKNRKD